jgi:hypothetical protein
LGFAGAACTATCAGAGFALRGGVFCNDHELASAGVEDDSVEIAVHGGDSLFKYLLRKLCITPLTVCLT